MGTILDRYEMVVKAFSVTDKVNWVRFFEKTFLMANVSPKIVLEIFFLTLSGANVDFLDQKLHWRIYITKEALLTIRHVELVGKKKFAAAALDVEYETFVVYIMSLSSTLLNIYRFHISQLSGLITKKTSAKISNKYIDFINIFFLDLASKLSKHNRINDHAYQANWWSVITLWTYLQSRTDRIGDFKG